MGPVRLAHSAGRAQLLPVAAHVLDPVTALVRRTILTVHDVLEDTTAALDDRSGGGVAFVAGDEHLVHTEGPRYGQGLAQDLGSRSRASGKRGARRSRCGHPIAPAMR